MSTLGLIFRVRLACAPGGSALPLGQLENGTLPEDTAFLDLELQEHAGDAVAGLVVFQQSEMGLYQWLVEAARNRLAELAAEALREENEGKTVPLHEVLHQHHVS